MLHIPALIEEAKRIWRVWLYDPPWRSIRVLGAVPVLGVSVSTLLATPFLAKSLFYLRHWTINFGNRLPNGYEPFREWLNNIALSLHLPLVIRLLAYSALFALIGSLIYRTRCPAYYRVGDSYTEFRRKHPHAIYILIHEFLELWNNSSKTIRHDILQDLLLTHNLSLEFKKNDKTWTKDLDELTASTAIRALIVNDRPLPEGPLFMILKVPASGEAILDTLIRYRDRCRHLWRLSCAWAYYLALGFFIWAVLSQMWWVALELQW